jgi:hypothetical protein
VILDTLKPPKVPFETACSISCRGADVGSLKTTVTFALILPGLNKMNKLQEDVSGSVAIRQKDWQIGISSEWLKMYLPEAVDLNTNIQRIIAISFVKLQ